MTLHQLVKHLGLDIEIAREGTIMSICHASSLLFVGEEHEAWRWLAKELSAGYQVSLVAYWEPTVEARDAATGEWAGDREI